MIKQFGLANVKWLHSNEGLKHDLVTDYHFVAYGSELVERLNYEPRALASSIVQIDSHGVLFHVGRQLFVDSQVLGALEM